MADDAGQGAAGGGGAGAYLLASTGSRIELRPGSSCVLGRAPDCDVVVGDVVCSRRHARILVGEGEIKVEDLGSRNGTYVDEERVETDAPLAHGCRLRVGATVYRVFHAEEEETGEDEPVESEVDTETTESIEKLSYGHEVDGELVRVLRGADGSGSGIAGQLDAFSLIEVLQILNRYGRSGTLHLSVKPGHGRIEIRDGEIHAATIEELEGFHALVMLARQRRGRFWLVEAEGPCPRSIREATAQVLVELCQSL